MDVVQGEQEAGRQGGRSERRALATASRACRRDGGALLHAVLLHIHNRAEKLLSNCKLSICAKATSFRLFFYSEYTVKSARLHTILVGVSCTHN